MHDKLPHVPLRLLGNRTLILRDQSAKKSGGGLLFIPDTARETLYSGTVLAVGPGSPDACPTCRHSRGHFTPPVRRGDRVFWRRYAENSDANNRDAVIPGFEIKDEDGEERELVFLDSETSLLGLDHGPEGFSLFRDLIVVRRRSPEIERGGIVIPDSAQKPENEGTIVAVGPGLPGDDGSLLPMEFKPGQYVHWKQYSEMVEPALRKYEPKRAEGSKEPAVQYVMLQQFMIEHASDAPDGVRTVRES